ncbi:MAG: decaprenyl-phosphate phosphoribosyltransferase [Candidatus Eisenbacteria bacterium]|uniref:Decaprenyl-phosphate phosphoribosyltransferase n=1 Tax=Eiseniibacteriota bacterium TaxID=2212470 RepID=A0A9D6QNF6_UNCEI|nr:decaprenyl-phosphate phosphoribosyltransferase [Candidatus Eisenbacteria bacterium]MBI3538899.1 decaprenyl-phosphate phosphoribosyltransferase [Candidatus Eisenbacteria bacterium]
MISALVQELRPRQWTKNLLLFAGVLFSRHITEPRLLFHAAAGFVAFSLLSGAVYLLNDLKDVESDRQHPRKRLRPIASGRLPVGAAWGSLVPVLAAVAALSLWLGWPFAWTAVLYLALNLAYTFGLKQVVLVDVFFVALGFVIRAIAGVQLMLPIAPETELSPWLLVCTFFGALFLALSKRRRELMNAGDGAARQRAVLEHYTPDLLDGLLMVSAASSLMSYALYTIWPATVAKFHTEALLLTVPFVAYGIFRYLYLVRAAESTEDPSQVLLTDRPLGGCVVLYVITVVVILYRNVA